MVTGDEGNLAAIFIVIAGEQAPRIFALLACIVKRLPADRPSHWFLRAAACKDLTSRADTGRAVVL